MGSRVHLAIIFPDLKFPNVQFKPQKSKQDLHKFQVECKVPGLSLVNPALKDRKFLMPQYYRSLTAASLASNFLICILNNLKVHLREVAKVKERDQKRELALIDVPHVKDANINPLFYYESNIGVFKGKKVEDMARQDWEMSILHKLVDSVVAFDIAKDEVTYHADRYQKFLFSENKLSDPYFDPSEWRDRLNAYLAEGTYLEPKDSTKKAPPDKVGGKEDITPSYVFAPRVTVVGGGPKSMSLVYHLRFDGNEVCSPCFFNKNIFEFSRSKQYLKNKSQKMSECEALSKIAKHLTRLIIQERVDYNYNSGTFDVDYYRDEGVKVASWEYKPSSNISSDFPMDKGMQQDREPNNGMGTPDHSSDNYADDLENLLSCEEEEEEHEDDMSEELENDESSDDSDLVLSEEEG